MKSALNSYSSLIAETFTASDIRKARGIESKKKATKKPKKKSGRI
jgi:hypothetical protein